MKLNPRMEGIDPALGLAESTRRPEGPEWTHPLPKLPRLDQELLALGDLVESLGVFAAPVSWHWKALEGFC